MSEGLDPHELTAWREEEPARLRIFWLQLPDEGELERVELTEGDRSVQVAIHLRNDMHTGGKMTRGLHACDVPLERPLADRVVIDRSTEQPLKRTDEQVDRGWDSQYLQLQTPTDLRRLG